jgi:S1-C subfamily serine protease
MHPFGVALTVGTLLAGAQPPGIDADDLRQALALQRVMQRTVAEVEPSVACILVSRSDAYQRLGLAPEKSRPGRRGDVEPEFLDSVHPPSGEDRATLRARLDLADPRHVPQSFGSGVVLDTDGLVLTNYHVVQDATKVYVRLPGGKGSYADIHAADPRSDLAVLRLLNRKILPLTPIRLGDADTAERGQFVLSIANPFAAGFRDGQPSASWGILSNIRRRAATARREEDTVKPLHAYATLLQTDARLHLGCSGGALVNLRGELIGLTTALAAIQGGETPGGFAIPVNGGTRRIIETLRRGEEVEYGFLGIQLASRVPDGAGAVVQHVMAGSPARGEGKLRDRDVIVGVDGERLRSADDLFAALGAKMAGARVRLDVRRPGSRDPIRADVTLAKLYVPGKTIASSPGRRPFFRGLRVDYASLLVQMPPAYSLIPTGVLVSDVQPNSPADRAFLKTGEVVTHVNGQPVATPAAFYDATANLRGPAELTLYNFNPQEPPSKVVLR